MITTWLMRRLASHDEDGTHAPGYGPARRLREPDGSDVTVIAQGEAFDLYFGKRTILNVPVTSKTLVRLAFWVIWWWVRHDWCGLKSWLWNRALNSALEHKWTDKRA